jgi:hypothetical protein
MQSVMLEGQQGTIPDHEQLLSQAIVQLAREPLALMLLAFDQPAGEFLLGAAGPLERGLTAIP